MLRGGAAGGAAGDTAGDTAGGGVATVYCLCTSSCRVGSHRADLASDQIHTAKLLPLHPRFFEECPGPGSAQHHARPDSPGEGGVDLR